MDLTPQQRDRAGGVLLGQAVGDALGVPYEFGRAPLTGAAQMLGGGLGDYAPGEWSDDTQMAACIAQVTASGLDPLGDEALEAVAQRFLDWYTGGPADIGNQTATVLSRARTGEGPLGTRMTAVSEDVTSRTGSAGNGALMRTGIVGLVALEDPRRTAAVARRMSALTHADPRCLDSCVLWSEAVRVAVLEGRFDVRAGVRMTADRMWWDVLDAAESSPPSAFAKNGFTVTALQAAWSAIHSTRRFSGEEHVRAGLQAAIEIGHDTDTVAAIAGALLGARYGASAMPADLVEQVHGWPGLRGEDLVEMALATAAA